MPDATSAELPKRPLGSTGLMVHPLCIGCAPVGNRSLPEEQALATIRAIFDGPINFVDTAAAYGDGESERRIGVVLRERGGRVPDGFVLDTKADPDRQTGDFSGDQMRKSVERSLNLLGLDRLQLVYLHDPEHTTFAQAMGRGGAVEGLVRCKEEGLVEHLGVAGGPIGMEIQYVETGQFEVVISHNRYTLLNTAADPLWDVAAKRGVAAVNAAPYGSGILAKGPGAFPRYAYRDAPPELLERARRLESICQRYRVPLAAAALQFSLRDQRIISTIVGTTRPERIVEIAALAQYLVPEELWSELATVPPTNEDPQGR